MRLRGGEWIDEEGRKQTGNLYAWGEWEPESIIVPGFSPPKGEPLAPKYLWDPYWIRRKDYSGLQNTDPFIFGDHFLYSNCKQMNKYGKTSLQCLASGSLIVFGSCCRSRLKWMLDTVLVVQKSIPYNPPNPRASLEDKVSDTFLEVTGGPLSSESLKCSAPKIQDGEKDFRLYFGETPDPDEPFSKMFSFFPAKPAGDNSSFPRPFIELPERYFNPNLSQGFRGVNRDITCQELRKLWDSIVEQVRAAGLVLGTHADLPREGPL